MRVRFRSLTHTLIPTADQQDLQRLFHEVWPVRQRTISPAGTWRPPTDVVETTEKLIIKMELAGVAEEAIDITLYADHVVVTGRRQETSLAAHAGDSRISFHEAGIHYGSFRADVRVPRAVDAAQATMSLEQGFLLIDLPYQR